MGILEKDFEMIAESTVIDFNAFRNKTFLITGATGLIGSLCAKALLYISEQKNLGISVICIVRNTEKAEAIFDGFQKPLFVCMDLMKDEFPVIDAHIDYIIHAASITNSKLMVEQPVDTILTSLHGTEKMLNLAVNHDIRSMVYISSMEVYGTMPPNIKAEETSLGFVPLNSVRSSYPESKRMCECLCLSYSSQYKLPVCCARLAQTFGAGILKTENRVFAQFAKSALKKENIILHTSGESEGNYVYSSDAVTAILFLLQKGKSGEFYNVNNEKSHLQIKDMAHMVADELSGEIKVIFDIPEDSAKFGYAPQVKLHLSSEKINSLGWKATIDLKESYTRMMEYMIENKFV